MIRVVDRSCSSAIASGGCPERFAGIRVDVKPRKIAARYVDADAMAMCEDKRRRIHLDSKFVG